ncbi:MAG: DNA recombination protein RmuC [Nitriliruptor sp.]|uniref:DNA recombination protein RmuC n=1 Tax=Nitriliruptor sp. TaxID=2448056 RepID=UPI00349FEA80
MTVTAVVLAVLAVTVAVLGTALWATRAQRSRSEDLAATLRSDLEAQQQRMLDLQHRFAQEQAARSQVDLQHAIDTLVTVAGERLDARSASGAADLEGKKALIDAELQRVGGTLTRITEVVQQLERDRADQLGQVTQQLRGVAQVHGELQATTGALREALTSSQARGQWGERMAEDVLRAAGFKHGVNYETQRTLPNGARPDVTFLLPGDLHLHMDVKFPLANYLAMLECDADADREACRKAFLKDVKARIRELSTRGYVDREAGTVDCVLLFMPNEQIYGYVHEQDATLLDEALKQQVVLCSPSTLFAVLAVIRQSCDTLALQRTSDEILGLLGGFSDQWGRYSDEVDKLGRQLETVARTYDQLSGTRRRQLEKQLDRVEDVRERRGVDAVVVDEERPRLLHLRGDDGSATWDEEPPALPTAFSG